MTFSAQRSKSHAVQRQETAWRAGSRLDEREWSGRAKGVEQTGAYVPFTMSKQRKKRWRLKNRRRETRLKGNERMPDKGAFDVFVTRNGKCYHPFWCATVNGVWLAGSNALRVVHLKQAETGGYDMCPHCDGIEAREPA
jgi:hypothetical protein